MAGENGQEQQQPDAPTPPRPFTRYFKITKFGNMLVPVGGDDSVSMKVNDQIEYVIAHAYRLGDQFCQFTRYVEDPALGMCEHGFLVIKRENFDRIDEVLAAEVQGYVTGAVAAH